MNDNKTLVVSIPVIRGKSIEDRLDKLVEDYKQFFNIHKITRVNQRPKDGQVTFEVEFTEKQVTSYDKR